MAAPGFESGGPFRQVPLRYFGYANELGEAFKAFIPRWAYFGTYGVAAAYVGSDALWQGWTDHQAAVDGQITCTPGAAVTAAVADTVLWQGTASVIIPGFLINRLVATTSVLARRIPVRGARFLPTAVGLGAIPFIVAPIDRFVDHLMDSHVRPKLTQWRDDHPGERRS